MSTVAEDVERKSSTQRNPLQAKNLVLRCMVFKNNRGEFTAECVDLDIMAGGDTSSEALQSLMDAMKGYLHVALDGDATGLVPRPSPWTHRAQYHYFALRAAFAFGLSGTKRNFMVSDWSPGPGRRPCFR